MPNDPQVVSRIENLPWHRTVGGEHKSIRVTVRLQRHLAEASDILLCILAPCCTTVGHYGYLDCGKSPSVPAHRSIGMLYVESSAKTAVNVAAIFECVAEKLTAPKKLPQSVGLPVDAAAADAASS